MAYASKEARQDLLDTIADAIDEVAVALAALGAAYEQLDERSADELEEQLFRPVQVAYGRAQRTYTGFAARHTFAASGAAGRRRRRGAASRAGGGPRAARRAARARPSVLPHARALGA